jgi:hypothetical protein
MQSVLHCALTVVEVSCLSEATTSLNATSRKSSDWALMLMSAAKQYQSIMDARRLSGAFLYL